MKKKLKHLDYLIDSFERLCVQYPLCMEYQYKLKTARANLVNCIGR